MKIPEFAWHQHDDGWWYFTVDGEPDDRRYTKPVDHSVSCTHSEQSHNDRCAWCGMTSDHLDKDHDQDHDKDQDE